MEGTYKSNMESSDKITGPHNSGPKKIPRIFRLLQARGERLDSEWDLRIL
jgi:hypothetical protein